MPDRSPYEVLGYEKIHLSVDPQDLERRFFQLCKKFHPDRFAGKSQQENAFSHDHSSAINNAYRTLKNPILRAKYLVEKELGNIEEKSASVPPDMADLFFEVHDHLDVIQDSNGNAPASSIEAVAKAESELKSTVVDLEKQLLRAFTEYDQEPGRKSVEQMKEILSHRSYIQSFLRQIDNVLGRE